MLIMGDEFFICFEVGALYYELLGFGRESELRAVAVNDCGDERVR